MEARTLTSAHPREARDTRLHEAVANGEWDLVTDLIESGADPRTLSAKQSRSNWIETVNESHASVVERLIEGGADLGLHAEGPDCAIAGAAEANKLWLVSLLLKHGGDPDLFGRDGLTALMWAVLNESDRIARALLDTGNVDVNKQCDPEGTTALHIAASNNALCLLHVLLKYGANRNVRDITDRTPFQNACTSDAQALLMERMDFIASPGHTIKSAAKTRH